MDLRIDGKAALVFGASRGIGRSAAMVLAEEGARVAIAARQLGSFVDLPPLLLGPTVLRLAADLTDTTQAQAAVDRVVKEFGRLDIMVVSAGAAQGGLFWDLEDETWLAAMDLKFMGMVRALRAAAPVMRAQRSGRIVVVVGNAGKQPNKRMLPGASANAACLAVVRGLAEELGPCGVQVNAINPGPTRTGRWTGQMEHLARVRGLSEGEVEGEFLASIPFGRISEPEEIARLIAILCSEVSGTTTGTSWTVDGGMTAAIA